MNDGNDKSDIRKMAGGAEASPPLPVQVVRKLPALSRSQAPVPLSRPQLPDYSPNVYARQRSLSTIPPFSLVIWISYYASLSKS